MISPEGIERIREAKIGPNNPMYGKTPSDEIKQQQSVLMKGIPKTLEHRKNIGLANKGKKRSPALIEISVKFHQQTWIYQKNGITVVIVNLRKYIR